MTLDVHDRRLGDQLPQEVHGEEVERRLLAPGRFARVGGRPAEQGLDQAPQDGDQFAPVAEVPRHDPPSAGRPERPGRAVAVAEALRGHGLLEGVRDQPRPEPVYGVPVTPLADQLGHCLATVVTPPGHAYGEEVTQPVQGVLANDGVVPVGERVGQVPQATGFDEELGLHRDPVDQRMLADDVGDPRRARTARARDEDR